MKTFLYDIINILLILLFSPFMLACAGIFWLVFKLSEVCE